MGLHRQSAHLLRHRYPLPRSIVGYKFGYELLMLNGALTFAGLALIKKETVKYKQ